MMVLETFSLHLAWFHWTRDFIQTKMPFGYNPCVYGMHIPYYSELSASFNIALTTWPDIIALFVRMRNWHLFGSNGMNIYESKWMASLMAHNWTINLSRKGAHTHTQNKADLLTHAQALNKQLLFIHILPFLARVASINWEKSLFS